MYFYGVTAVVCRPNLETTEWKDSAMEWQIKLCNTPIAKSWICPCMSNRLIDIDTFESTLPLDWSVKLSNSDCSRMLKCMYVYVYKDIFMIYYVLLLLICLIYDMRCYDKWVFKSIDVMKWLEFYITNLWLDNYMPLLLGLYLN